MKLLMWSLTPIEIKNECIFFMDSIDYIRRSIHSPFGWNESRASLDRFRNMGFHNWSHCGGSTWLNWLGYPWIRWVWIGSPFVGLVCCLMIDVRIGLRIKYEQFQNYGHGLGSRKYVSDEVVPHELELE